MRSRTIGLLVALVMCIGALVAVPTPAAAAEKFNPGNIIADSLFYDASAMTQPQIQAFLDRKVGTCSNGRCLNVLTASISSRSARYSSSTGNLICKAVAGGTLRVSEIIYRAQVACGISAKVILVTLQKEQGLVTSKSPSQGALDAAMGQACPDTAPCDPAYKGVGVQIVTGAQQLKTYKASRFARQPGSHAIRYHPNTSCGSNTVNVVNYATAALYNYTPYQPNAAALANMNGTGNSCSSYGNRNFWRDYTAWFGSTQAGSVSTIDTVPHLLAFDSIGELWAYPSNGKGGWRPRVSLGAPWTDVARTITPGGLDGDGHRDLITVSASGAVSLHRGDGILGYLDPVRLAVDWSGAVHLAAAGDYSGDGVPDIFTTDSAGALWLWRGTDNGGLRSPIQVGSGWTTMNLLVGASDLSGDGKPDLIARRTDGALMMYTANGRGGWFGAKQIGWGWNALSGIFVPGDVNGDKRADILATNAQGSLLLYAGAGGGSLKAGVAVGSGWNTMSRITSPGPASTGVRVLQPGAGDVDGDLARDVVATRNDGALMLYRGSGTGGWAGPSVLEEQWGDAAMTVSLGDFDGDGLPDLGRIETNGAFTLARGSDRGGFDDPVAIGNGWLIFDLLITGLDFDGDRRLDVIGRDAAGQLRLYRGNGAGGWLSSGTVIGNGWSSMTAVFAAGDFDGDRAPDLLARRADGALILYSTDGSGRFKRVVQVGSGWQQFTALFSPGDFDKAGGADIIGRLPDGQLRLYKTSGKGTFTQITTIGTGWNVMTWIG